MTKKVYSYGDFFLPIKVGFSVKKRGWYLTEREKLATPQQQKILKLLGWGKDDVTFWGAEAIIQEILEIIWND